MFIALGVYCHCDNERFQCANGPSLLCRAKDNWNQKMHALQNQNGNFQSQRNVTKNEPNEMDLPTAQNVCYPVAPVFNYDRLQWTHCAKNCKTAIGSPNHIIDSFKI